MPLPINVGDRVQMKKSHPCGGDLWEILRSGADFKLRCEKCGRLLELPRPKLEKGIKKIIINSDKDDR